MWPKHSKYGILNASILSFTAFLHSSINLFIGFTTEGINNFAHLGGLLGGYIASMSVGVKYKSTKGEKTNGTICLVLLIIFLIYMSFFRT